MLSLLHRATQRAGARAAGRVALVVLGLPLAINLLAARNPPLGILVHGAIIGSLYSLVAMGLVLLYQANRIINFAAASLGASPAVFALMLMVRRGVPYALAIPIALIGAAVFGALIEVFIIRRFRRSSRLILTVATIAIAQLLAFVEFWIPKWVTGETLPPTEFPTPFADLHFRIGVVQFTGDHVLAIVVVGVIVAALGLFLRYTDIGIAIRASADNGDRASLLGIPVRRVGTVVWMIAAVLSAAGIFLRAPIVGVPIGGLIGPSILLYGLTAAVIARMQSLPTAFVAGICVGVIDQSALYSSRRSSLPNALMLGVILIALLAQRRVLSRAQELGASTWQVVTDLRPIPAELRGVRVVRLTRAGLLALVALIALGAPYLVGAERRGLITLILIYGIIASSLVILTGWAGQVSLGQFGIAGVGAAVAGGLATYHNLDFFVALVAAGLAGMVAAMVVGLPALRIQGMFLAVTTLAFAFTVESIVLNPDYSSWLLPGRDNRLLNRPMLYGSLDLKNDLTYYFVCLSFLVLTIAFASSLRKRRSGRVFIAVRDNPQGAQAYGINLARTRLAAFAISGFFAGLGGALLAYQQEAVDSLTFTPGASIALFTMVAIGGLTSLAGAIVGPASLLLAEYFVEPHVPFIAALPGGLGLLVILLRYRGGIAEAANRLRNNLLRRVAERSGIYSPSLLADYRVVPIDPAEVSTEDAVESVIAHPIPVEAGAAER